MKINYPTWLTKIFFLIQSYKPKIDLDNPEFKPWTIAILLIVLPTLTNDFLYIHFKDNVLGYYLVDYGYRILILSLIFYFFGWRGFRRVSTLKPKEDREKILDYILFPLLLGIPLWLVYKIVKWVVPNIGVFAGYPVIQSDFWYWMDLTFGLALVAVSEEYVYRKHLYSYIAKNTHSDSLAIWGQAFIFSLMHWSNGLQNLVNTFIFGLVTGYFYDRKKDLFPPMIIHFLMNFWSFY